MNLKSSLYFFQELLSNNCLGNCSSNNPEQRSSAVTFDHAENLYVRFKNAEASQSKLIDDYNALQTSYNELEKRLHNAECQAVNTEELKEQIKELEKENERLRELHHDPEEIKKRLSDQETEQIKLKNEMKTLESVCTMISTRLDKVNAENNQVKTKHDNLLKQSRNQKNELEKLQNEVSKLKEDNKR